MKDLNHMGSMSSLGTHSMAKWNDVLDFLGGLYLNEEVGEVHITKKEDEDWNIQIDVPKKKKPIALTTNCRGVGLFDLNW